MSEQLPLLGRVGVITGSTRGLGLAMARLLGRSGARVVVASRTESQKITAQRGFEPRLDALPIVIALWGRSPAEAARPLLRLVTAKKPVYRGLNGLTLATRGLHSIVTGRRRTANRVTLEVTTLGRQ